MELRHLRYFVVVAEEENVTRASEKLRISQPPLSRQIRDLEEELGVQLFERTAKAIRLTAAGKVFLAEARAVLRRVELAVQTVRSVAGGAMGELNVGYAPTLTVELLPEAMRWFQAVSPEVRVVLHDLNTEEMLQGLHAGRLQIAVMAAPGVKRMGGLNFEALREYEMGVAMRPDHPLAELEEISFAALKRERLIGYSRQGYPEYHEDLAKCFAGANKTSQKVPLIQEEHDSVSSLVAAVESGGGLGLVATSLASVVGARLVIRRLAGIRKGIPVGAVWRKKESAETVSRFLEGLRRGAPEKTAQPTV